MFPIFRDPHDVASDSRNETDSVYQLWELANGNCNFNHSTSDSENNCPTVQGNQPVQTTDGDGRVGSRHDHRHHNDHFFVCDLLDHAGFAGGVLGDW